MYIYIDVIHLCQVKCMLCDISLPTVAIHIFLTLSFFVEHTIYIYIYIYNVLQGLLMAEYAVTTHNVSTHNTSSPMKNAAVVCFKLSVYMWCHDRGDIVASKCMTTSLNV